MTNKKIETINAFLKETHALLHNKQFQSYEDLYMHLVGLTKPSLSGKVETQVRDPEDHVNWSEIYALKQSWKAIEKKGEGRGYRELPSFFVNGDSYWTYVEAVFVEAKPSNKTFIKLYAPVKNNNLLRIANAIFNDLYARQKTFLFKIAHHVRKDNICLWIRPEELDRVIDFLQQFSHDIVAAPIFCPEYRSIGITRELCNSFNEAIANTLYAYLQQTTGPNFNEYVNFFEGYEEIKKYNGFDYEIVLRSLKCIQEDKHPITDPEFSVVNVDHEQFSLW